MAVARRRDAALRPRWCSHSGSRARLKGLAAASMSDQGHPAARCRAPIAERGDRRLRRRPRRPPAGDPGCRHGADLRAPSAACPSPRCGAEADHAVRDQARRDRGAGSRGADRDPVRRRVLVDLRRGLLLADPDRGARRPARLRGRELPLRRQGEGRPADARLTRGVRDPRVVPLVEVDGEIVSSTRIRSLVAAGEIEAATRCLDAPFLLEGHGGRGGWPGPHARFPDRQPRARPTTWCARATASMPRSQTGRPAAVNVGIRPTFETGRGLLGRGIPDRLRRRPVRADAADRFHQPAAGRTPLSRASRSSSPRCIETSKRPEISVLASLLRRCR